MGENREGRAVRGLRNRTALAQKSGSTSTSSEPAEPEDAGDEETRQRGARAFCRSRGACTSAIVGISLADSGGVVDFHHRRAFFGQTFDAAAVRNSDAVTGQPGGSVVDIESPAVGELENAFACRGGIFGAKLLHRGVMLVVHVRKGRVEAEHGIVGHLFWRQGRVQPGHLGEIVE